MLENSEKCYVFFDGYCVLCNSFVQFLIKIDKKNKLLFGSIQGETAKKLLNKNALQNLSSVLVLHNKRVFIKSSASLHIFKVLGGFWKLLLALKIFPKWFRDLAYDFIAKNRYRWFGKREQCRLPNESEKQKILP